MQGTRMWDIEDEATDLWDEPIEFQDDEEQVIIWLFIIP